ncbi:hypothetical protein P9869_10235, partial [Streptomyces ossamyceticus]|nr:hypothetical protein [Streptomyces ossamyceticus]
ARPPRPAAPPDRSAHRPARPPRRPDPAAPSRLSGWPAAPVRWCHLPDRAAALAPHGRRHRPAHGPPGHGPAHAEL